MVRLDKTLQEYQEQLKVKGIQDVPEFVQSILDADMTKGKYSRFLLDCFLADKFREEDLQGGLESTIGQATTLFHKHKNKLPEEQRSVYKYESPGDLWNAVKQFDGELSGKELKKDEKEKVYAETEFLYEDTATGFKIITPLTEESAKWWGKGTRWCTSAEKNNSFWHYAEKAPLLIFLMPDGEKLQLWKHENDIQFMNKADNSIKTFHIEEKWSILFPVCLWLKDLRFIPKKLMNYDLCLEAVKQNGSSLPYVPEKYRDYNLCLDALKKDGRSLFSVPKEYRDYNLCLEAIKQDGRSLQYVSREMIDYNLCLKAVKQNGKSLSSVPEEYKNYNLCLEAVKKYGKSLFFVPQEIRDYNICLEAVKQNGYALYSIPTELRDYNMCLEAVKQNGNSLSYIPEEHKDYNMCLKAVKNNGHALQDVPEKYRDYNICLESVKQNGYIASCIPNKYKDKLQGKIKKYIEKIEVQLPKEKYQQVFSEIRSYFPEKELSLTI